MADDPWAAFNPGPTQQVVQPPISVANDPWAQFSPTAANSGPSAPISGRFLPITRDDSGVHFDSNAGIVGSFKRAFNLPGEVMRGEIDPRSPEGLDRAMEMAGVVTPVNPAVRAGERAIPGIAQAMRQEMPQAPSGQALRDTADAGYKQARGLGVEYSADAVKSMADTARATLERDGILAELAPKSFQILDKLANPPAGSTAPITGLEAARRAFGHAARDFSNPTEQLAASRITQHLDDFLAGSNPQSVVAGPADQAAKIFTDARGNYAAAKRSERLTDAQDAADLSAAAANSGANADNALRQRAKSILLSDKQRAGFDATDQEGLRGVVEGTMPRNILRVVGNLLGGGGGLGAIASGAAGAGAGAAAGGTLGAVAGAAVPAVGVGAKAIANALTRRAFEGVDAVTRTRSPLYEDMAANASQVAVSPERRAAIIRLLMSGSAPQGAQ